MFGKAIDYRLLKPLTHDRNRATQAELDEQARATSFGLDEATAYLKKVQDVYFAGRLPVDPSLSYLDIGCGMGRLSIGLCHAGTGDVTGIDINAESVKEARAIVGKTGLDPAPEFLTMDIHDWTSDRRFDVIFVLGAMEHIHDPAAFLAVLPRYLKPEGRAFVSIEPFRSPNGDHNSPFFRFLIPWRGLLFSEQALLQLRRENYRPSSSATRYQDVGLNLMTFSQYLRRIADAGLEVEFHNLNPQVKFHRRYRMFYPFSWALTHVPKLQDFFIICGYSILRLRR